MKKKLSFVINIIICILLSIVITVGIYINSYANQNVIESNTTVSEPYWCDEGGSHHVIDEGHGWYKSYKEAERAALANISSTTYCHYEVQECDCGLFTYYYNDDTSTTSEQASDIGTTTQPTTTEVSETSPTQTIQTSETSTTQSTTKSLCNHNWAVVTSNSGEHLKYCTLCGAEEYEQCQFAKNVVNPTCENEGYTEYYCICGYSYKTDYTSPSGHKYEYISNNDGTHHRVCIKCGLQQEDENCVEIKSDDENKCKYCNYIFQTNPSSENTTQTTTQQATTEPCRHDMELYKENTQHYYKCSKCGFVEYEKHAYVAVENAKATCTNNGYVVYRCNCGDEYTCYSDALGHSYIRSTKITPATTSKNGNKTVTYSCSRCGSKKVQTQTINKIKQVTLSKTSFIYNGKVQIPSITIKDYKNKSLKNGTDYTVKYYNSKSKAVGKYYVLITFKGNYAGKQQLNYYIIPKNTKISQKTSKSKGFKVVWKKQTTQTTGYQIQYSTSKNMKSAKTITISNSKTTKKTVSKLKAKRKYYIRIRTYKAVTFNGKRTYIYSSWSKISSVTTKK